MIEFYCASCGKVIGAGEDQAGQQCSCPYCSVVQIVPRADGTGAPPPPPQGQGMPQAPGQYAEASEAAPGVSGIATLAFILGLCSIVFGVFTAIPAIILAIIAVAKGARGKGLAVAGFFCALILGSGNFLLMSVLFFGPRRPGGNFFGFGRARGMARKVSCQANVRMIGMAVAQYWNDNEDWLPKMYTSSEDGHTTYAGELAPYLGCEGHPWLSGEFSAPGAPPALTCPSERKDFGENILAYGWNWSCLGTDRQAEGAWWIRRKVEEVKRPGETSCLGESRPMDKGRMFEFDPLETTIYWGGLCPRVNYPDNYYMGKRHDGGANYLCVDGHIEFAEYDDLVDDWQGNQRIFSRGD